MLEADVYEDIRDAKAKPGHTGELTREIKEAAIPIISDVTGLMAGPATAIAGPVIVHTLV